MKYRSIPRVAVFSFPCVQYYIVILNNVTFIGTGWNTLHAVKLFIQRAVYILANLLGSGANKNINIHAELSFIFLPSHQKRTPPFSPLL